MKLSLNKLRQLIKEELVSQKLTTSLETLSSFQDRLDDMLMNGTITSQEYDNQWNDILSSLGWTKEDYENEIDRRWDYVDKTRDVPIYGKSYGSN